VADDNVVEQLDVQVFAGLDEVLGGAHVFGRGRGIARGWLCTTTMAGLLRLTAGLKTSAARTALELTVP
jgi:hypothetical protein